MREPIFDKNVYIPFANSINDTNALYILISQLETLKRFLFKDKEGTISQKAGTFLSSNLANIFRDLEEKGLEPPSDSKQMLLIDSIINYLENLPEVKITMAFEPSATLISKLNNEISKEHGQKVVLDVNINQFIVAGAAFEFNGKYREYTLALRIDEFIEGYVANMEQKASIKLETATLKPDAGQP